jgi:hypothetical protein
MMYINEIQGKLFITMLHDMCVMISSVTNMYQQQ